MKYYIYVSDTKVDMLYSQIPSHIRDSVATELRIDLKLLSATVSKEPGERTRFSKLKIVIEYIEKCEPVGTVDNPDIFFKETMPLQWGPCPGFNSPMVYFGGTTQRTILGLGGSSKHVIGHMGQPQPYPFVSRSFGSELLGIENTIADAADSTMQTIEADGPLGEHHLSWVAYATERMWGPVQSLEFLAKRLKEGYLRAADKHILVGSPIYVALAG